MAKKGIEKVKDRKTFEKIWSDSNRIVVLFTASWCGPCQILKPMLKRLAEEYENVRFISLDVDASEDNSLLSDLMRVQAVPTIFYVSAGTILRTSNGLVSEDTLRKNISML